MPDGARATPADQSRILDKYAKKFGLHASRQLRGDLEALPGIGRTLKIDHHAPEGNDLGVLAHLQPFLSASPARARRAIANWRNLRSTSPLIPPAAKEPSGNCSPAGAPIICSMPS